MYRFCRDDVQLIWYTGKVSSYDVATGLCAIIYDYKIDDDDDDDDCIDEDENDGPNNDFQKPILEYYQNKNGDVTSRKASL